MRLYCWNILFRRFFMLKTNFICLLISIDTQFAVSFSPNVEKGNSKCNDDRYTDSTIPLLPKSEISSLESFLTTRL